MVPIRFEVSAEYYEKMAADKDTFEAGQDSEGRQVLNHRFEPITVMVNSDYAGKQFDIIYPSDEQL